MLAEAEEAERLISGLRRAVAALPGAADAPAPAAPGLSRADDAPADVGALAARARSLSLSPAGDLLDELSEHVRRMAVRTEMLRSELRDAESQATKARRDASRRTSLKLYRERMRQTVTSSPGQMTAFTPGPEMIRLLIVDDDPFQADAIQMLCHECGYRASLALSASSALEQMQAESVSQSLPTPTTGHRPTRSRPPPWG